MPTATLDTPVLPRVPTGAPIGRSASAATVGAATVGAATGGAATGGAGTETGQGFLQLLDSAVADVAAPGLVQPGVATPAAGIAALPGLQPAALTDRAPGPPDGAADGASSGLRVPPQGPSASPSTRRNAAATHRAGIAEPEPPSVSGAEDDPLSEACPADTTCDVPVASAQGQAQDATAWGKPVGAEPAGPPNAAPVLSDAAATSPVVSKPSAGASARSARSTSPVRTRAKGSETVASSALDPQQGGAGTPFVAPDRAGIVTTPTNPPPGPPPASKPGARPTAAAITAPTAGPLLATADKEPGTTPSAELSPALAGAVLPGFAAHLPQDPVSALGSAAAQPAKLAGVSAATGFATPGVAAPLAFAADAGAAVVRTPAAKALPVPAPASVVAPVLLHLTRTDDIQRLSVRLDPAELGAVEIRVERAATGPARVELVAAHAGTLDLLRADATALNRALDTAGVPPEGRQISFSLGGSDTGSGGASSDAGGSAFSGPGYGAGQNGQQTYGRTLPPAAPTPAASGTWQQFGVDLLA